MFEGNPARIYFQSEQSTMKTPEQYLKSVHGKNKDQTTSVKSFW